MRHRFEPDPVASVESDARFVEAKEKERDEERDPAARQQASLAKSVRAKREAASSARDRLAARLRRAEDELRALEEGARGGERGSPRKRVPDEDEEERTETVDDPETTSTRRAYATLKPRLDDANAESATLAAARRQRSINVDHQHCSCRGDQ